MSLLDSREQRQITLINSNRKRHHAQLTKIVHRGRDNTQNSLRQLTEDGTVHRTHRDSAQRTGQYTELTETVHRGRDSTHTGTQYTEDGTVHTNHQNTVLKMGRDTPHRE